ncbi:hypothetical protein COF84_19230 [Bacillus wiedmannii]|uniref:hypothetical protein n=1 Tax=Bacillus wiedmannii TaxID=1890302 RepID=UPI000BFE2C43|nr:hypothetical protein [Bacillus wiedmannii]PHF15626.1 hypothetical protein COF84_19230 [Bacillus wiedmannii]
MENNPKELNPLEKKIKSLIRDYKNLLIAAPSEGDNTPADKSIRKAIANQTYMLLNKLPDLHTETSNATLKGAISKVLRQTTTEFTSIDKLSEEEVTELFEYPKFLQTKSGQALELFINEFESYYISKNQDL